MTIEKSIGWCSMTCNPIKGRCKGGCWYCYYSGKRGILNRFKQNPEIQLDLTVFRKLPQKSKKIFLCSTHDLFGSWIPNGWRRLIFGQIELYPQHSFQILTKFPQNIDRPMPDNVWLGVTVTGIEDEDKLCKLWKQEAKLKFVSFEPLLSSIHFSFLENLKKYVDWAIVGRLTGYGNKHNPKLCDIVEIRHVTKVLNVPLFMKDNLKEIWGGPLIQEFPND